MYMYVVSNKSICVTYSDVHIGVVPLVVSGSRSWPDRGTTVCALLFVHIESVHMGTVHVIPEVQALGRWQSHGRTHDASGVVKATRAGGLNEDVVALTFERIIKKV